MKIAVFDLETAKSPDEVEGGWDNHHGLGISSGVAWISWEHQPHGRFLLFGDQRLPQLVGILRQADLIVGFNSIRFDRRLLEAQGYPFPTDIPHCDLMLECERSYRKYVSLDELSRHTLGRGKSGHGACAPILAQRGKWDELYNYNIDDVALTRDLFLFGCQYGYLLDSRERIRVTFDRDVRIPPEEAA